MAKIYFVGLDGSEKAYRLQTHRPFTVGRDPGNDIILRDPKVSRHHAEIVFERGFFVLHDLASANGPFVNGKKIRVAPLTHGAQLRLGNSYGRFSEELPTESDDPFPVTEAAAPHSAPDSDFGVMPTSFHERSNLSTMPHPKITESDAKKKAE
jgi:pSer/pThr/pTyr-binding forkhead associated (FHA) protein